MLSRGISYVLSVCGLSSYLATMEVSKPMKSGRMSQLSTKGWLSRTRGPFYYCHRHKNNFSAIQR